MILANKRKPWVLRPNAFILGGKRPRRTPTGSLVSEPDRPPRPKPAPVEQLDPLRHVPETKEQKKTVTGSIKATAVSVEHIDLLRPIPDTKERQSSSSLDDEEM
jgi:hypothetical protein